MSLFTETKIRKTLRKIDDVIHNYEKRYALYNTSKQRVDVSNVDIDSGEDFIEGKISFGIPVNEGDKNLT